MKKTEYCLYEMFNETRFYKVPFPCQGLCKQNKIEGMGTLIIKEDGFWEWIQVSEDEESYLIDTYHRTEKSDQVFCKQKYIKKN